MFLTTPRRVGESMQSAHGGDAETEIGKVSSRACESCYRAKAKCIPQAGRGVESDKCSR